MRIKFSNFSLLSFHRCFNWGTFLHMYVIITDFNLLCDCGSDTYQYPLKMTWF